MISAQASTNGVLNTLATTFPTLKQNQTSTTLTANDLMLLSGTSVSSPVVAGTVALLLQKNPGLTPPLVKGILQYTSQQIPAANIAQQGAGLLNIEGAVRIAGALRTDLKEAIANGTIRYGDSMLAPDMRLPVDYSTVAGQRF